MVKTTVAVPGPSRKRSLDLEIGPEALTSHGGLALLVPWLDRLGLSSRLESRFSHLDGSRYAAASVLVLLLVSKLVGDDRLDDLRRFGSDLAVKTILGMESIPHPTTVSRMLEKMTAADLLGLEFLWAEILRERLLAGRRSIVVDVDATPLMVWGKQEGAARGYCPKRHGAPTYSPNLAFDAKTGLPLHQMLRPGDRNSLGREEEFRDFLEHLFAFVLRDVRRVIFRADSGYFAGYVFDFLEGRDARYVVSARGQAFPDLKPEAITWSSGRGRFRYGEFQYRKGGWTKARRFVIKRNIRKEGQLFTNGLREGDVVLVTNKEGAPKSIAAFYNDRGTAEQYIAEGKQNFAFEKFPSKHFLVNKIDFQLKIMAMGLMTAFRDEVVPQGLRNRRPGTIRRIFVNVAAKLVRTGRRLVLRFTRAVRHRDAWERIFLKLGRSPPGEPFPG